MNDPANDDELHSSKPIPEPTVDTNPLEVGSAHEATLDSGSPARRVDNLVEKKFGNYTLVEELARGGMGVVYKATDDKLNRTVALKMILSGRFASDQDVRRFYQEAESAARLDHAGIVPIYEIGEQEGHHFFAMKLMEGGSLAETLPKLRDQPEASVRLIAQTARAVHYAHQRGILHRDIKPANVLLDADGNPAISDLGLAKNTESQSDLTRTGAVVGTPSYMPPEQAAGQEEITTSADIYSLGAILYEALTGQPPHKGQNMIETLRLVMEEKPASPRSINSKVDRSLELICMKCLEHNPDERYSSAAAFADDLEAWLEGKPISASPPSIGARLTAALEQNLRSAIGAAGIGLLAGIVASAVAWMNILGPEMYEASQVYAELPSEQAEGFYQFGLPPLGLRIAAGIVFVLAFVLLGLFNVFIVKPKNHSQALAIGLVSGLAMTITMYSLATGFLTLLVGTHIPSFDNTVAVTRAAIGSPEEQAKYERALLRKYPDLRNVEPNRRAHILYKKIISDDLHSTPFAILMGVLGSTVACLVSSIGGTLYASKLLALKKPLWRTVISYLEVVGLVAWCTLIFATFYCFRLLETPAPLPSWPFQIAVAASMGLTAWAAFRMWSWKSRLMLHIAWVAALVWFSQEIARIEAAYPIAQQKIAEGDLQGAANMLEQVTRLNPDNVNGHFWAGIVQSRLNNLERYRRHSQFATQKFARTSDPVEADRAAKLALLKPDSLDDFSPAIELAKVAVEEGEGHSYEGWFCLVRTLAAYREGKFEDVDHWAARCHEFSSEFVLSTAELVHAMALARRGKQEQSVETMNSAVNRIEKFKIQSDPSKLNAWWVDRLIFETLLEETRATVLDR